MLDCQRAEKGNGDGSDDIDQQGALRQFPTERCYPRGDPETGDAADRSVINIGLSVVLYLFAATLGYLVAERLNGGSQQVAEMQVEEEDAG